MTRTRGSSTAPVETPPGHATALPQVDGLSRDQGGAGHLPSPPKPRRRWGLFAAMAAVVCLGALGNLWLLRAFTDASSVLAARVTIERGSVISRDDLIEVQVGIDPSLQTVPADRLESLVGSRAAVDVAAGSLLTPRSVTDTTLPETGYSLVGVSVTPDLMPGTQLLAGDRIRVVATPGQQGDPALAQGELTAVSAVVVSAVTRPDATGQGAPTVVTVQVPAEDATRLAAMAATGKAAVVLDSRAR